ncbi:MAG: FAD-dependent oxidoreductase [bacterium]|nr:FAD-dependent oxidoreductase [bacterium]
MKVVIIGGVAAGSKVAAKTRRLLPESQIDIYTKDSHVAYSTCGLPYYIGGDFDNWQKLVVRTKEEFEKSNITIHLFNEAIKILPKRKEIIIKDTLTGKTKTDTYDKLVIATGSSPIQNDGYNKKTNLFTLKTLEDGIAIKNKMMTSRNIVLLGGGYINIELMEAFVKNNKNVVLIESSKYILPKLDEEISELVYEYITKNSKGLVKIITNDFVEEFVGKNEIAGIFTNKGLGIEADMVVSALGSIPNVDIAKEAGIEIGITGAIKVNSRMETNIPDIYACGDCAEKFHIVSQLPVWIPLGSTANKEGRIAAVNLCGGNEDFEGVYGSTVTRYFDLNISKTGLTEKMAKSLGIDVISITVTKKDKAGYMPDSSNMTFKLIADKRSHKIIGAQAIGCGEANKKVDNITVGLENNITIHDLINIDLTYSPPFASSVDIIHTAAMKLQEKLLKS